MAGEDHTNERQDDGEAGEAVSRGGAVVGFTLAEAEARGLLSADLVERRVSLLRAAVPEAFGEGVVDWGLLQRLVEGEGARKGKGGGAGGGAGGETGEEKRTGDDKQEEKQEGRGEGEEKQKEGDDKQEEKQEGRGEGEEKQEEGAGEEQEEEEEDEDEEDIAYQPFGLFWAGRQEAEREVVRRTTKCLRPQQEESVDWQRTQNVFIEGENLAVLKLLASKAYFGAVKMIYIDPPYNTGKDFVYSDKFAQRQEEYWRESGQTDEAGKAYTTNKESDGRFHSKWLSMMYPRLVLARELLREDGVIFISINDNEVHHLRMLCDRIFGVENFLSMIAWQGMDTVKNDAQHFSTNSEFILVYAKDISESVIQGFRKTEKQRQYYKNPDNDPRGDYLLTPLHAKSGSASSNYIFTFPNGQEWTPPAGRYPSFTKSNLTKLVEEGRIYLDPEGKNVPQKKTYLSEVGDRMRPITFWSYEDFGSTRQANAELRALMGRGIFDNPKPVKLLKKIVDLVAKDDDLVLDFFAGSCTTAHAVMQLNAEDGGQRRFVMVQLPEETPADSDARQVGYKTIADIGRERIRRAAKKIKQDFATKTLTERHPLDLGFKSFKLDSSNFKIWEHRPEKIPDLLKSIQEHVDRRIPGRSQDDVLYEILLKYGYLLTDKIVQKSIAQHDCHLVGEEGRLLFCLQDSVTDALLDAIEDMPAATIPRHIVMFDHAFQERTSLRANFYYVMKNKASDVQRDISVITL